VDVKGQAIPVWKKKRRAYIRENPKRDFDHSALRRELNNGERTGAETKALHR